ncbi:autotransporter outer membrane beta-barrel domain-containing protein [Salmonella enterica]|nr:autotransporter outer membrane beta-barrel domain-containing protein [Salmonella enterica]
MHFNKKILACAVSFIISGSIYADESVEYTNGSVNTLADRTINSLSKVYTFPWSAIRVDKESTYLNLFDVTIDINDEKTNPGGKGWHTGYLYIGNGASVEAKGKLEIIDNLNANVANRYAVFLGNGNKGFEAENLKIKMLLGGTGIYSESTGFNVSENLDIFIDGSKTYNTFGIVGRGDSVINIDGNTNIFLVGSKQNGRAFQGGELNLAGMHNNITVVDGAYQGLGWGKGIQGILSLKTPGSNTDIHIESHTPDIEWQLAGIDGSLVSESGTNLNVTVSALKNVSIGDESVNEKAKGIIGILDRSTTGIEIKKDANVTVNVTGPEINSDGYHGTVGISGKVISDGDIKINVDSPKGIGIRGLDYGSSVFSGNLISNSPGGYSVAILNKLARDDISINIKPHEGKTVILNGDIAIVGDRSDDRTSSINIDLDKGSYLKGATGAIKNIHDAPSMGYSGTTNKDSISISLKNGAVWHVTDNSFVNNLSIVNTGLMFFNHGDNNNGDNSDNKFRTVTVNGDYNGNNGGIIFNTRLEGDDSPTDKLVINGNTSGNTFVTVRNIGGMGKQTLNGIELIHVEGVSDGTFTQNGRIVAGAYDYHLIKGVSNNTSNNWYLTNSKQEPQPEPDPTPDPNPNPDPTPDPTPDPNPNPTPQPKPAPNSRPEGGSYVANLAAANTLFNTRLHDRSGETWYLDPVTGEAQVTSLWLRQVGSHSKWRDGSGQLKTQANNYVAQLGGDLAQWSTNGINEVHLGLMTGYANSHSSTKSSRTGYGSKGSLDGYSVGVYGTWLENTKENTGLYVDSWLQYSWFNNSVNGEGLAGESYKSRGLTASVESGYTLKLGETTGSKGSVNEWFIQPQAQATWMGVKADDHRETNGTVVKGEGDGNLQTRLGVRAFLRGSHAKDADTGRRFEPFIEANWLHNTRSFSATMDGARISEAGSRNLGEVKAGVEAKLNPNLNLWGSVGTQAGTRGYQGSTATVGVKVNF